MVLGLVVTVEKSDADTPTRRALQHILQGDLAQYEWRYVNVHGPVSQMVYLLHADASRHGVAAIIVAAHGAECSTCIIALARLQSKYPATAALVEGIVLDTPPASSERFFHEKNVVTEGVFAHLSFPRKRIVILRGGLCSTSATRGMSESEADEHMLGDLHSIARVLFLPPPPQTAKFANTAVGGLQCRVATYDNRCTLIYVPKARCNVLEDINAASNVGQAKFAAREMLTPPLAATGNGLSTSSHTRGHVLSSAMRAPEGSRQLLMRMIGGAIFAVTMYAMARQLYLVSLSAATSGSKPSS